MSASPAELKSNGVRPGAVGDQDHPTPDLRSRRATDPGSSPLERWSEDRATTPRRAPSEACHRPRRLRWLPSDGSYLDQKSQSSSSVTTALPITYDEPDPEKKSWFSSAFGESAERIAGFTSVTVFGNIGS